MRLPRRVPWASISELDQLCSWIFADENDISAKTLAVNRLSAWKAITPLPHALESALALLVVTLQDSSPQSSSSCLSLRHSYAACIIRLVNGLVDPLQLGVYARSIASIAAQLGLPAWLVELRHAATHEDLPSLELLREAARESLSWLLHNYFMPILNPSTIPSSQVTLRPLALILKRYKSLLKIVTRDASLRTQCRAAINNVLREVERWIGEAKVAANVAGFGWESDGLSENGYQDTKERFALDKLCDALLGNGILVPLSKKKRTYPDDSFSPPKFSVLLWSPLLTHIQSHHPDFPSALANHIVSRLLSDDKSPEVLTVPRQRAAETTLLDASFDTCIARWVWWIINTWVVEDPELDFDLKRDVIAKLFAGLGPGTHSNNKAALGLLHALCKTDPDLETALALLFPTTGSLPSTHWNPSDIVVMDQRLNFLLSPHIDQLPEVQTSRPLSRTLPLPPGWCLLDENSHWKPSPIGTFVGVDSN